MIVVKSVDVSGLNQMIGRYTKELGLGAREVVCRQAGLLKRDLVKYAAPRDQAARKKSETRITDRVTSRFDGLREGQEQFVKGKGGIHGSGEVHWYKVDRRFLHGVAKEADYRTASVSDLRAIYPHLTASGRLNLPMHRKGTQRVLISKKIVTKESTVKKLIKQYLFSIGRLKAAWAVGWDDPRLKIKGQPLEWVRRHMNNGSVRGKLEFNLNQAHPTVEIINSANGVDRSFGLLKWVIPIRVESMKREMVLILKGIKDKNKL